jgi:hypothetical protein
MGGMGGTAAESGSASAAEGGDAISAPGRALGRDGQARESATPEGPELLRGLEATKRRLQGKQVDELQRLYERGKGGMGGGVGAGGFF